MKKGLVILSLLFLMQGCAASQANKDKSMIHYQLGVSYLNEGDSTSALRELLEAEKFLRTIQGYSMPSDFHTVRKVR